MKPFFVDENMKTCSVVGCGMQNHVRKGLCEKHYARLRKYGSIDLPNRKTLAERFHEKYEIVTESGCWIWTGALGGAGYGAIQIGVKEQIKAHRLSWNIHHGEITDGLFVCHRCDVPSCVNPNHLFLGTRLDNSQDMKNKKRGAIGTRNGNVKLSVEQVINVFSDERNAVVIASELNVNPMTIRRIRTGENWNTDDVKRTRQLYKRLTFQESSQ